MREEWAMTVRQFQHRTRVTTPLCHILTGEVSRGEDRVSTTPASLSGQSFDQHRYREDNRCCIDFDVDHDTDGMSPHGRTLRVAARRKPKEVAVLASIERKSNRRSWIHRPILRVLDRLGWSSCASQCPPQFVSGGRGRSKR